MSTDGRRMDDIQKRLGTNRQDMGQTLDQLQHRLSGDYLLEQGRYYLRASGSDEFVFNLRRSARRNPLPLALLGVGVGWLMLASSEHANRAAEQASRYVPDTNKDHGIQSGLDKAGDEARQMGQNAEHAAAQGLDKFGKAANRAGRQASTAAERARSGARQTSRAARRGGARLRDGANYMGREQPLIAATIALVLGGLAAAGLPRSAAEDRAMGSASDDLREFARETGQEKAGQAQSIAESAAEGAQNAARSEAERQGLHDHERED